MTDHTQLFRSIRLTLISSAILAALLGCQPTTTEDSSSTNATEDVAVDSASEHDMHDEHGDEHGDEHADHDMTDENAESDPHAGHDHASKSEPFVCEPEATIGVFYHNDDLPQTAHLLIDGIEYDLEAPANGTDSSIAPLYTSDIGLDDTYGIIWQPSGDSAILSRKTLDSDIAPADEEVLYTCQKASE